MKNSISCFTFDAISSVTGHVWGGCGPAVVHVIVRWTYWSTLHGDHSRVGCRLIGTADEALHGECSGRSYAVSRCVVLKEEVRLQVHKCTKNVQNESFHTKTRVDAVHTSDTPDNVIARFITTILLFYQGLRLAPQAHGCGWFPIKCLESLINSFKEESVF